MNIVSLSFATLYGVFWIMSSFIAETIVRAVVEPLVTEDFQIGDTGARIVGDDDIG